MLPYEIAKHNVVEVDKRLKSLNTIIKREVVDFDHIEGQNGLASLGMSYERGLTVAIPPRIHKELTKLRPIIEKQLVEKRGGLVTSLKDKDDIFTRLDGSKETTMTALEKICEEKTLQTEKVDKNSLFMAYVSNCIKKIQKELCTAVHRPQEKL